ncbi:MAG: magnesium transporter [Candidatus Omnitrophica bacterium]|nr:magnesium transporter [Candidatus Omnitrophota bacterium]
MEEKKGSLIGPEILEILSSPQSADKIRESFAEMLPYDIFVLCDDLQDDQIARCIKALGVPTGIELFQEFNDERKREIFSCFSREWMADILEEMDPDERADFVNVLPEELTEEILPLVARAERLDIKKLMEYEEETAGAIMTTDYAVLPPDITVKSALERLKLQAFDKETIYYIYVTDDQRRLIGLVTLRDLIVSLSYKKMEDIMRTNLVSANVSEDKERVAEMLHHYDFLAIPIVNDGNCLVGIVTVDDVVDVVIEESTEDIYKYGAAGEYIDYMSANFFRVARQRAFWLLILIFVGFITAWVLKQNSVMLETVVALSFFIPLLLGSGGNAGTQSSTVVIRGLATGDIKMDDLMTVVRKELIVGVIMGASLGSIVTLRALWLEKDIRLGIVVGLAMIATIILGTVLGALLPILFKKMKLDPALMSGPFITSIVDVVSLMIYFRIAFMVFSG